MDCAILLRFDRDTEASFNNIIEAIAAGGVGSYMVDAGIPPHITITGFSTDQVEAISTQYREIKTWEVSP